VMYGLFNTISDGLLAFWTSSLNIKYAPFALWKADVG